LIIFILLVANGLSIVQAVLKIDHSAPHSDQLSKELAIALSRNDYLEKRCTFLEEMVRLLRIKKYGPGAERLSSQQLTLLELEPGVCSEEVAQESASAPNDTTVPTPNQERKKKPSSQAVRAPLPKNLPRQERIIALPARECTCVQCGENKKLIGYECSERLAIKPIEMFVEVIKREKRACARCEEAGVSTTPVPAAIVEKEVLADSLVVETIINKHVDNLLLFAKRSAWDATWALKSARAR
jgi:hypothetical protein